MLVFVLLARAYVDGGLVVSFDDNVSRWVADNRARLGSSRSRASSRGSAARSAPASSRPSPSWCCGARPAGQMRCSWRPPSSASRCSSPVLKAVYERARPDLGTVIPLPHSYSFPSGHAATAVVLYGALGILLAERASSRLRAAGWLAGAALLALAIGTSRVLLNVHFVSDVAAGFAVGLAWLCCCAIVRDVLRGARESGGEASASPQGLPQLGSARGRPGEPTSRAAARGARSPA